MRTFGPASRFEPNLLRPLLAHSAHYATVAIGVVFAIGMGAGAVRLLPWLVAPQVPFPLAVPFAERLLRAAFDVAVVIGLPVGVAAATADFVEGGQARALLSLGTSPARLAASIVPIGLAAIALNVAADLASSPHAVEKPGHFVERLVQTGRDACARARGARVDIPIVGASWLCFAKSPTLVGRVPALGADVVFSASDVALSEDGSSLELRGAHFAGTAAGSGPAFRARAATARVAGLFEVGGSGSRLTGLLRCLALSGSAGLVGVVAAWFVLWSSLSRPVEAACIAAGSSVAMLLVVHALDRWGSSAASYLAVPSVGLGAGAALAGARAARDRFARVAGRAVR